MLGNIKEQTCHDKDTEKVNGINKFSETWWTVPACTTCVPVEGLNVLQQNLCQYPTDLGGRGCSVS